jgi:uncharacterized protein
LSPWSRPLEVEQLADTQAEIGFSGEIAGLPGLRSLRAGVTGNVRGQARFSRELGFAVAELSIEGCATLVCQRCMQPMELPLEASTRIALITAESESARVPAQLEPVLAAGGRTSLGELVAEELLLTLPIVPLHLGGEQCLRTAQSAPAEALPHGEMHRPFAGLGELLKR